MSDILQRLRLLVPSDSSGAAIEAADTIAHLTARVEDLEKALELFACDCQETGNLCAAPQNCQNYIARAGHHQGREGRMSIIAKIDKEIAALEKKKAAIQNKCSHPATIERPWYYECELCGAKWTKVKP